MKHVPLILLALVCGCGSSPHPDFYTLYSEPGTAARDVALQIELRQPGLPGYLDRSTLVRREKAGRLDISGTERWGTHLGELVGATLTENLTQRLPSSTIYSEAGVISTEPDIIVEVDLQRFELGPDGKVRLDAQVALHWANKSDAALVKRYELASKPKSDDTDDMVATMSALLGELSQGIARSLATVASGGPPDAAEPVADEAPEPPDAAAVEPSS